jgi:hypothetical protein
MSEPWGEACDRLDASILIMAIAGKDQEWVVVRQPDVLTVTTELREAKAEIEDWRSKYEGLMRALAERMAEVGHLKALNAQLLDALENPHAMVEGECPSLLEDDHHDDLVRAAIKKARGES